MFLTQTQVKRILLDQAIIAGNLKVPVIEIFQKFVPDGNKTVHFDMDSGIDEDITGEAMQNALGGIARLIQEGYRDDEIKAMLETEQGLLALVTGNARSLPSLRSKS